MTPLLRNIAARFAPTCPCGDGARALAAVLAELADSDAYRAGYAAARAEAEEERAELLADAQRNGWCTHVHPAIEDSVRRMFGDWGGATLAEAENIAGFRARYVPQSVSSPKESREDWARGYAYRDAMSRHGGVLEGEAAGEFHADVLEGVFAHEHRYAA